MTNETLHTLETRRSCRAYKPEQITKEELEAVLRAGTFAPSAMNRQSAKIVVVQDAETRAQLTRMNAAVMGNTGDPMYGAPTILVVLADANARCGVQDGSLVMGNLMNAAAAIGLGSCWINRAKEEFETEEGKALGRDILATCERLARGEGRGRLYCEVHTKCLPVLQFFKTKGYRVLGPAEAEAAGISMQLTTLEKML